MLGAIEAQEGFFKKHYVDVLACTSDAQLEEFGNLSSNVERFRYVYKLPQACKLSVQATGADKDASAAGKLKEQGNKEFQAQNYKAAWKLYTQCIHKIPWQQGASSDLAVAVANRSAALYHLQEYDLTMDDVELSLSLGYPRELQYKVMDRKARCLLAKKQLKSALTAFRETLTALDSAKLDSARKKKWQLDVQIMLSMLGKNPNLSNAPLGKEKVNPPPVSGGPHSTYTSASTAVQISETENMGRFAVANRNVGVGETLVVEPAFCSALLAEHAKTHCFECFRRLKNHVPCFHCTRVSFCSYKCQQNALRTHHKPECGILDTLWHSGASVTCFMALRILSQFGLEFFLNLRPQLGQKPPLYETSDYLNVYNLVTHESKRTKEDLFHRANMSVFLFKCLKEGGFFSDAASKEGEELTENELFVGSLLLHHLQLLQYNAHEISELVLDKNGDIETGQSVFIGGGVFPTLALFNHSCDPGIIRYFLGTSVVARAAKNIEGGSMIAENYGPIFTQHRKEERKEALLKYCFDCSCIPCQEDWPLFEDMRLDILRFKCDGDKTCKNVVEVSVNTMEFMIQCPECKQYTNILKGLKALQDTEDISKRVKILMEKRDIARALETYCELLNRLDQTLAPPFRDFHLCQQGLRRCMLYLGNRFQQQ